MDDRTSESPESAQVTAIYFDSQPLHRGNGGLSGDWLVRFCAFVREHDTRLFAPQLVVDELVHDLCEWCIPQARTIIEIEQVTNAEFAQVTLADSDWRRLVELSTPRRLAERGVSIIPNASPDLDYLIERAVRRAPPFSSDDRGFRDAIIIESIYEHAREHFPNNPVMVVSGDKMFRKGVRAIVSREVNVTPCIATEALGVFRESLDIATQQRLEEEGRQLIRFLERSKEEVFEYIVKQTVSMHSLSFGRDILTRRSPERLIATHPKRISWASLVPRFSVSAGEERIQISFGVEVELDLVTSGPSLLDGIFSLRGITLNQPGEIPNAPITFRNTESEETISHTVPGTATVRATGDINEPYADLRLGDDPATVETLRQLSSDGE